MQLCGRNTLVGVIIGIVCYSLYVLVFGRFHSVPAETAHIDSTLSARLTSALSESAQSLRHQWDRQPQQHEAPVSRAATELPAGMTPVQVCEALQSKYHVRSESDLEHVDHNVQYHWKNLQCSDKVALVKVTKAERLPDVPQTPLADVMNKASGKADAATTAPDPASSLSGSGSEQGELQLSAETEKQCRALALKHHVVPGRTWGTLTTEQQRMWSAMRCDKAPQPSSASASASEAGAGTGGSQEAKSSGASTSASSSSSRGGASTTSPAQGQGQGQNNGQQGQGAGLEAAVGLPQLSADSSDWCHKTRSKYNVLPMKSWGQLPFSLVDTWKARKCDLVFTSLRMRQNQVTKCGDPLPALSLSGLASSGVGKDSLPLIAIMAATTTRKVHQPSTQNLALFTMLLPSLVRSIDCGFRYVYVLGYDKGDPFYDDNANLQHIQKWFKANIQTPMSVNGVSITLKLVKVNNSLKKPGPVFVAMARAAYGLGADYFYRINDDTELMGHWPSVFVSALKALPPPFGVVGPTCLQGNGQILTHDFTSRTHMEVFEMNYYPPVRSPSSPLSLSFFLSSSLVSRFSSLSLLGGSHTSFFPYGISYCRSSRIGGWTIGSASSTAQSELSSQARCT
jgi:hypothetical protein